MFDFLHKFYQKGQDRFLYSSRKIVVTFGLIIVGSGLLLSLIFLVLWTVSDEPYTQADAITLAALVFGVILTGVFFAGIIDEIEIDKKAGGRANRTTITVRKGWYFFVKELTRSLGGFESVRLKTVAKIEPAKPKVVKYRSVPMPIDYEYRGPLLKTNVSVYLKARRGKDLPIASGDNIEFCAKIAQHFSKTLGLPLTTDSNLTPKMVSEFASKIGS